MKHLILFCLFMTIAIVVSAQNFELRLVEESQQVRVQMRSIDEKAPTTDDVFHDLVFGISWTNSDLERLLVSDSDYGIRVAGPVREKGGRLFQPFAGMSMPLQPAYDWVSREWIDIAILTPQGGSKWDFYFENQLTLTPMGFDVTTDPNVGYAFEDHEPVLRENRAKFTLLEFEVTKHKEAVAELFWHANEHENLASYVVERSPDGEHWKEIGIVYKDNGNYRYTDYTLEGVTREMHYRLRINDSFGSYDYSDERQIAFDPGLVLYPNPATDRVFIEFTGRTPLQPDAFVVFDSQGKVVYTRDILEGSTKEIIEVSQTNLVSGMYFIEFRNEDTAVWNEKFEIFR